MINNSLFILQQQSQCINGWSSHTAMLRLMRCFFLVGWLLFLIWRMVFLMTFPLLYIEEMVTVGVDSSVLERIAKIMSYLQLGSSGNVLKKKKKDKDLKGKYLPSIMIMMRMRSMFNPMRPSQSIIQKEGFFCHRLFTRTMSSQRKDNVLPLLDMKRTYL